MAEVGGMLLLAAALTFGAVVLFFRRCWRFDGAWHCVACNYNLTGLTAEHCPECGADLRRPKARTQLERLPNPGARWTAAILLVGALLVWGRVAVEVYRKSQAEWYRYRPTFIVLRNLSGSDLNLRNRACEELYRRQLQGGLSPNQRRAAIAAMLPHLPALYAQRKVTPGLNLSCNQALADGLMTPQQIRDFLPWVDWARCRWSRGDLWLDGDLNMPQAGPGRTWVVVRQVEWIELDGRRVSAPLRDLIELVPERGFLLSWKRPVTFDWSAAGPRTAGRTVTLSIRTTWYEASPQAFGPSFSHQVNPELTNQLLADSLARPIAAYSYTATLNDSNGWQADFNPPPTWLPVATATQPITQSAAEPTTSPRP